MYQHVWQQGTGGVELLSPSGSPSGMPVGPNVLRKYDREIKGYLFAITANRGGVGIQCPASSKDTLGIIQPLLVFQIQTNPGQKLTIEVVIVDRENLRHRLYFSSSFRTPDSNQLHAQLPWAWSGVQPGTWCNSVINMMDLTSRFFHAEFCSLESFHVKPACQLRKVFSLPASCIQQGTNSKVNISPSFNFPYGVPSSTVLYSSTWEQQGELPVTANGSNLESHLEITGKPLLGRRTSVQVPVKSNGNSLNRALAAPDLLQSPEIRRVVEMTRPSPAKNAKAMPIIDSDCGDTNRYELYGNLQDGKKRLSAKSLLQSPVLVPLPSPPLSRCESVSESTCVDLMRDPMITACDIPQPPLPPALPPSDAFANNQRMVSSNSLLLSWSQKESMNCVKSMTLEGRTTVFARSQDGYAENAEYDETYHQACQDARENFENFEQEDTRQMSEGKESSSFRPPPENVERSGLESCIADAEDNEKEMNGHWKPRIFDYKRQSMEHPAPEVISDAHSHFIERRTSNPSWEETLLSRLEKVAQALNQAKADFAQEFGEQGMD